MDSKDNQICQKDLCSSIKIPETRINGSKRSISMHQFLGILEYIAKLPCTEKFSFVNHFVTVPLFKMFNSSNFLNS